MTDLEQVVWELLTKQGTGLYTLCATRVWCSIPDRSFQNTQHAIVFHTASQSTHASSVDFHGATEVFKCYGGSENIDDARDVYHALHDRLHGVTEEATTTGRLIRSDLISAFQGPNDPEKGWPTYFAQFRMQMT